MEQIAFLKLVLLPFLIAFTAVCIVHPHTVKIAKLKKIVDNPNARKLQKEPVPVLGGVAVFFGIFISLSFARMLGDCSGLLVMLTAMMMMLYLGAIDDILDLRVSSRILAQLCAGLTLALLGGGEYQIDSFCGLFGIHALYPWLSVILSVFIFVAIANATNLIDGVDGLSSGFGVLASLMFLFAFIYTGDHTMIILCAATMGAMVIFFLHNVFGKQSKMFIGDSGTLVLGTILSCYVLRLIHSVGMHDIATPHNLPASVIPFTIAVLAIPVFDTLRVMVTRIAKRKSPFHPDKTHLHHMFIELGFSHVVTTLNILGLNILIVGVWAATYFSGWAPSVQLLCVIVAGITFTYGLFFSVKRFKRRQPEQFARLAERIHSRQPQRAGWFLVVQRFIDKI